MTEAKQPTPQPTQEPKKQTTEPSPTTIKATEEPAKPVDANSSMPRSGTSVGLTVGVAVIVAVVLVLLGVLAYQNSDSTSDGTNESELPLNTSQGETTGPVTSDEVLIEFDNIESDISELETQIDELGETDLGDEALELE